MIEDPADPALYTREFGSRPLQAFGLGLLCAVLLGAIGTREYDNSTLVLEQRGENVFVLRPRDSRSVVSVIQDIDPDHVRAVFATAGIERITA